MCTNVVKRISTCSKEFKAIHLRVREVEIYRLTPNKLQTSGIDCLKFLWACNSFKVAIY